MAQALTVSDGWTADLALATPPKAVEDAGLRSLPSEWQTIDSVVLEDVVVDHVGIGPNGVFTISIDPDPVPVEMRGDGIYRNGDRVTTTVKNALRAAYDLRHRVGERLFAYPILVTPIQGSASSLDRLGVVPAGRIPEAIWSHGGLPMTRSQRMEITWTLRSLSR